MIEEDPPRMEDLDPATERRLHAVISALSGSLPVSEAARMLGISRERYYQLQRKAVRALREALTPEKPGPKGPPEDPEREEMKRKVEEAARRERDLAAKLEIAKRQTVGPKEGTSLPPKTPRKGDHGNRYGPGEKQDALDRVRCEQTEGGSQKRFCAVTGYAPRTLQRWARRPTLEDRPSRPLHVANRTPEGRREEIRRFDLEKRGTYGAEAIRLALGAPESVSTIGRILREERWEPKEVAWMGVGVCQATDLMALGARGSWGRLITTQEAYSRYKPVWDVRGSWDSRKVAGYQEAVWEILGTPLVLKHDQGTEFASDYFQDFLRSCGVVSLPSPVRRPSYNGQEERANRFIRAWTRPVEKAGRLDLLGGVLIDAWKDLNYDRRMSALDGRTSHEAFVQGPRPTVDRQGFLQEVESRATIIEAMTGTSRDRFRAQRRATVSVAQAWGLLRISPRRICQPISA